MATNRGSYLKPEELPELYQQAGRAALRARRLHDTFLRLAYSSIVLAVIVSLISPLLSSFESQANLAAATLLGLTLAAVLVVEFGGLGRSAYGARVLAESIRSISWRYMAKAAPFQPGISAHEVDNRFIATLRVIMNAREALRVLPRLELATDEITEKMRQIRAQPAFARADTYFRARVERQRLVHSALAAGNRRQALVLAMISISALAAGLALSLLMALRTDLPVQPVPAFAALGAAALGWSSHKRNQELYVAHRLTEYELGLIASRQDFVNNDQELSRLATDAENAIAKEHTLWAARRVSI